MACDINLVRLRDSFKELYAKGMKAGKIEVAGLVCINGLPDIDWKNICYGDKESCYLPPIEDCSGSKVLMSTHTHPMARPLPSEADITSLFRSWARGDIDCGCIAGKYGVYCYTMINNDFTHKLGLAYRSILEDADLLIADDDRIEEKDVDAYVGLMMENRLFSMLLDNIVWQNPRLFVRSVGSIPWEDTEKARAKLRSVIQQEDKFQLEFSDSSVQWLFKQELKDMERASRKGIIAAEEITGEEIDIQNTINEDLHDRFKTVGLIK